MICLKADTRINYKFRVNGEENYGLSLTVEQLEGSTPCLVKQVRKALGLKKDDVIEVIEREVVD